VRNSVVFAFTDFNKNFKLIPGNDCRGGKLAKMKNEGFTIGFLESRSFAVKIIDEFI